MRIGVTGGRDYADKRKVHDALSLLWAKHPGFTLVVGDAKGTDQFAREWAAKNNVNLEVHYADWDYYGRSAGPIRNRKMADSNLELLLAFPGGSGTNNMVSLCKERHIKIHKVD